MKEEVKSIQNKGVRKDALQIKSYLENLLRLNMGGSPIWFSCCQYKLFLCTLCEMDNKSL